MFNKKKGGQCAWSISELGGEWPVRNEAEKGKPSRALFIGHREEFGFFFFFKGIMETTEGLLLWKWNESVCV